MPVGHIQNLQCVLCGTTYDPAQITYACPTCGPLGVLEVHYDYSQIAQRFNHAQLAEKRDQTMCVTAPSYLFPIVIRLCYLWR